MGECGCGGSGSFHSFPAPNRGTYVIQLRPPCEYCPGPADVQVHRYSLKEAKEHAEGVTSLEFFEYGDARATSLVSSVLNPEVLRHSIAKWLVANKMAKDEYDSVEYAKEMIEACVVPLLFEEEKATERTEAE